MGIRVWACAPLAASAAAFCVSSVCVLGLAACDGAPSANPARAHASDAADRRLADAAPGGEVRAPARYADAAYTPSASRTDPRTEAAPLFHGKPMWAANKTHTAQENADYHYKRDGEALGAASEEDFLAKVHAFVDSPPKGVQTLTRSNGDRLLYDAKANLFAVVDRDGAPRTLFKPRDGAAYWAQQKDSVAQSNQGGGSGDRSSGAAGRRSGSDDNG